MLRVISDGHMLIGVKCIAARRWGEGLAQIHLDPYLEIIKCVDTFIT